LQQCGDTEDVIADVERIARQTYQRSLGVGLQNDQTTRQWLALTAAKGWLRGYVLYLDDQPVAFWIGTLSGGVFRLDYIGYDPAYERLSPGVFLLTRAVEDLCQSTAREVDFGHGSELYKQQFGNCTWHEAIIYINALTLKGIAFKVMRTLVHVTDRLVRILLERTNLLPRLKRAWRTHLKSVDARSS